MIKLRSYQDEGKRKALEQDGFALFMEQRTGKTPLACEIIAERNPHRLLIACPKMAIPVWETHLKLKQYGIKAEVRVMTFESLWSNRKRLRRWRPDFVVGDETHRIKDRRRKQSKALRKIARTAQWRLALTGTPIEGKIEDAWAQFDFIDPAIFGPWKDFEERYLIYGGYMGYKIIGYRNLLEFRRKFHSRFYRVLLEDVKETKTDIVPPQIVSFNLAESQSMYDSMEGKFIVELQQAKHIVAPRVITQMMKLHQISGGFILDDIRTVHRFGDEKLAHCGALLLHLGKVPTVIVVRFLPELYRIAALCRVLDRTVTLVSGDNPFAGFSTDVAIVQIRSGISVDLSRAEELIFYSWGHSYLDYDQAKFRIRSYTSKRARYWYLIAKHTIDEDLFETVTRKLKFTKLIIDKYRTRRPQ